MAKIDGLPSKVLLDTGVLIRALGHRPSDPDAELCRDLFDAAVASPATTVFVAAPSLAEIERGAPEDGVTPTPIPRNRSVVVVSFDRMAAEVTGQKLPFKILKECATRDGLKLTYLKYDALIIGCALRWGADVVVTLDSNSMRKDFEGIVRFKAPKDFLKTELQPQLPNLSVPTANDSAEESAPTENGASTRAESSEEPEVPDLQLTAAFAEGQVLDKSTAEPEVAPTSHPALSNHGEVRTAETGAPGPKREDAAPQAEDGNGEGAGGALGGMEQAKLPSQPEAPEAPATTS